MIFAAYRIIGTISEPLISAYLTYRLLKGKEDRLRFKERKGITKKLRPGGYLVWFHAASIGESLSLLPLINRLHDVYPEFKVLITTGTVTSAKLMDQQLPSYAFHQYVPVDRHLYVKRFLKHWKPALALWSESEFWPNLLHETARERIPLILVQGRVSLKSYRKWRLFPWLICNILRNFTCCLAQTRSDADRLKKLGAVSVKFIGNLKSAASPLSFNEKDLKNIKGEIGNRSIWLAASTHPGEEEIIWDVHQKVSKEIPDLLTIIVPRHSDRGKKIASKLSTIGAEVILRSDHEAINKSTHIYLADTIGELGLFYRLVDIVFVGKSLVNLGGQNLIEPAWLCNAILHGPHMWNFSEIVERMSEKNAMIKVNDGRELVEQLLRLFGDAELRRHYSELAFDFANSEADVINDVFQELNPFFKQVKEKKITSEST